MREFIGSLPLPPAEKERLLRLEPGTYLGLAPALAQASAPEHEVCIVLPSET